MFKLLITDDETIFVNGLIKHIKWRQMGIGFEGQPIRYKLKNEQIRLEGYSFCPYRRR
jgi:hypothetical protein